MSKGSGAESHALEDSRDIVNSLQTQESPGSLTRPTAGSPSLNEHSGDLQMSDPVQGTPGYLLDATYIFRHGLEPNLLMDQGLLGSAGNETVDVTHSEGTNTNLSAAELSQFSTPSVEADQSHWKGSYEISKAKRSILTSEVQTVFVQVSQPGNHLWLRIAIAHSYYRVRSLISPNFHRASQLKG